ncbi:MAG: pentapeptide repeat-containing protein [Terracidiphilus sp.]|jgi:hypothetical protein
MANEQEVASAERLAAVDGIASEESVGAELEIEANEGPMEEPVRAPNESAVAEVGGGDAGCPIEMGVGGPKCGRHLHEALYGSDEKPVCLMHSKDPNKQSGPLFDAFWLEFEKILEDAGNCEANFSRFVFPQHNFSGREFQAICRFEEAIFAHGASFFGATFKQKAVFWKATFSKNAEFRGVSFMQNAYFNEATFMQHANFGGAAFTQDGDFSKVTFTQDADFSQATFTHGANFMISTFTMDADFRVATFLQNVSFMGVTFMRNANFYRTKFKLGANFFNATFTQYAQFEDASFGETAKWTRSRFLDRVNFRRTNLESQITGHETAIFALATFYKPASVVFDDVDLSRALFHNCDVSQVWFTSSVKWAGREDNRGLAVYEETIPLREYRALDMKRDGQRDYRAVAQIYQQLKKNYDSRLDYWTANEFHFGEMEMKRLAGPTDGWMLLGLRRWWHRNLSFVALYRWASDYGNSYWRPLLWLFGFHFFFASLYPLPGVGLKRQGATQAETYASVWDFQKSYGENLWAMRKEEYLALNSLIASVDVMEFQRNPEYTPVHPWGRVLAIFETLLASSLFALFLLAIRRQFRR